MKSIALLLILAGTASASPYHADAEVDPTAYALSGNSIHVGLGYDRYRLDLGNFALALPQLTHGNDGNDVSFDGYGVKLQMFADGAQRGWFGGVDAGFVRVRVQRGDLADRQRQIQAGVHVGYRIALGAHFYASLWLGAGYAFGAHDVTLDGATTKAMHVTVFPAIHLGSTFR